LTHKYVNVSKSDGAVRDEGGVEGVKVGNRLHVRDEDGRREEEDEQDAADDARVEPLVLKKLLLQTSVHLQDSEVAIHPPALSTNVCRGRNAPRP
jgi:hypothetical protein